MLCPYCMVYLPENSCNAYYEVPLAQKHFRVLPRNEISQTTLRRRSPPLGIAPTDQTTKDKLCATRRATRCYSNYGLLVLGG